jgi:hypothetical protein
MTPPFEIGLRKGKEGRALQKQRCASGKRLTAQARRGRPSAPIQAGLAAARVFGLTAYCKAFAKFVAINLTDDLELNDVRTALERLRFCHASACQVDGFVAVWGPNCLLPYLHNKNFESTEVTPNEMAGETDHVRLQLYEK